MIEFEFKFITERHNGKVSIFGETIVSFIDNLMWNNIQIFKIHVLRTLHVEMIDSPFRYFAMNGIWKVERGRKKI